MRSIQNDMESIKTEYPNISQGNNARTNNGKLVTLVDLEHIPSYFKLCNYVSTHFSFYKNIVYINIKARILLKFNNKSIVKNKLEFSFLWH